MPNISFYLPCAEAFKILERKFRPLPSPRFRMCRPCHVQSSFFRTEEATGDVRRKRGLLVSLFYLWSNVARCFGGVAGSNGALEAAAGWVC